MFLRARYVFTDIKDTTRYVPYILLVQPTGVYYPMFAPLLPRCTLKPQPGEGLVADRILNAIMAA